MKNQNLGNFPHSFENLNQRQAQSHRRALPHLVLNTDFSLQALRHQVGSLRNHNLTLFVSRAVLFAFVDEPHYHACILLQIIHAMTSIFNSFLLNRFRSAANPIQTLKGPPLAACFRNINLFDIPQVMREKKLIKGAEIMEHWFLGKPFAMPALWKDGKNAPDPRTIPIQHINETIITMQWALGFQRALNAYNELKNAIYGNLKQSSLEASQYELFENLKRDGKFTKKVERFGFGSGRILHKTAHINSRTVATNFSDKLADPLDDLYCALGAFGIHVAGTGTVTPLDPKDKTGTHLVTIVKLGFYIKDTYDFNEDQPLGYWSEEGVTKSAGPGSVTVENKSFRDWRARFNHGGDFMVFSDVRWEGVSRPIHWLYTGE